LEFPLHLQAFVARSGQVLNLTQDRIVNQNASGGAVLGPQPGVSQLRGYKLSFDPVPVLRQEIEVEPLHLLAHRDQYSLLHVELFGRHNHLVADPWQRHCSYYINVRHQLVQCLYDPQSGNSLGQRVVYTIDYRDQGDGFQHLGGDYNYSMCFVSERFCVICDGMTSYHLVDTGDRSRNGEQTWERITRTPVNHTSEYRGFSLYDAT